MIGKVTVDVRPDAELTLEKKLESAGQFAYRVQCVAQFVHAGAEYRVWYEDFHAEDAWRAVKISEGQASDVPRDKGRWGRFEPI